jgi:hypothetical protein
VVPRSRERESRLRDLVERLRRCTRMRACGDRALSTRLGYVYLDEAPTNDVYGGDRPTPIFSDTLMCVDIETERWSGIGS